MDVNETLVERNKTHGNYAGQAAVSQAIKRLCRDQMRQAFTADQLDALDMIAVKISRILCGDPNHVDSWHDIAGYATLVANRLTAEAKP